MGLLGGVFCKMLEDINDSDFLSFLCIIAAAATIVGLIFLAAWYPKILIFYAVLLIGGWILSAYYRMERDDS